MIRRRWLRGRLPIPAPVMARILHLAQTAPSMLQRKCLVHDGLSHGRYATNFGIFVKRFFL